ncbi:MAG: hypothetical protein L3K02_04575 [Thermoplasmata archaeon]|nr:hypothetical protein [Thermoplasmata archaeon]
MTHESRTSPQGFDLQELSAVWRRATFGRRAAVFAIFVIGVLMVIAGVYLIADSPTGSPRDLPAVTFIVMGGAVVAFTIVVLAGFGRTPSGLTVSGSGISLSFGGTRPDQHIHWGQPGLRLMMYDKREAIFPSSRKYPPFRFGLVPRFAREIPLTQEAFEAIDLSARTAGLRVHREVARSDLPGTVYAVTIRSSR